MKKKKKMCFCCAEFEINHSSKKPVPWLDNQIFHASEISVCRGMGPAFFLVRQISVKMKKKKKRCVFVVQNLK